jgi:CHASE2 domain-containing sensor protein
MEWLGPWYAPFIVLVVTLFLFFYVARGNRADMRQVMKHDINFYLVAILATAIVSIFAGLRIERDWLDVAAWIVAAMAVGAVVWRFMNSPGTPEETVQDDRGPLERNDRH